MVRLISVRIHNVALELAGRQFVLEHDVQLLEGSVLGLRESEPSPNQSRHTECEPKESSPAFQVELTRIDEHRLNDTSDGVRDIVGISRKHNGLGSKTGRGYFSGDTPSHRTDGEGEEQKPDDREGRLCVNGALSVGVFQSRDE